MTIITFESSCFGILLILMPSQICESLKAPVTIVTSIGPSGVRALPLAAGINEGGHYFRYFGPIGVRAPAVSTWVATIFVTKI